MRQARSGILDRERPGNRRRRRIAPPDPSVQFLGQGGPGGDPAVQALPVQDAEFEFGHVQPTPMLRRVMDLEAAPQAPGVGGWEGGVQGARGVGIEIVEDQDDPLRLGKGLIGEVAQGMGKVRAPMVVGDGHLPPAKVGSHGQEEIGAAVPGVLGVLLDGASRTERRGGPRLSPQLLARLVETDQRARRIGGTGIDVEHVLHRRHEVGILLRGNAPAADQPWFEIVFLSVVRRVSGQIWGTISSVTSSSASSRRLQRAYPGGGAEQATFAIRAWVAVSNRVRPFVPRERGWSVAATPASAHRARVRATVRGLTPTSAAMVASVGTGRSGWRSAASRMLVRRWVKTVAVDWWTTRRSAVRSAGVN